MPVFARADVEVPALKLFEQVALDVQATREGLAAQLDTRVQDAQAQAARADRDVAVKRAALARFDTDYAAGVIGGENYTRLTADYTDQLAAAEAEHARLAAHADHVAATLTDLDSDAEALHRLADLRVAVAQRVTTAAGDVGALRAAMTSVFERVSIEPEAVIIDGEERPVHVLTGGHFVDEDGNAIPEPKPLATESVATYEVPASPRFRVVPWLRPEAYSGGIYERVADLNAALAGLPVKRVGIEFEATGMTKNNESDRPLPRKLGIKAGQRVALLGAPDGFEHSTLGELPDGVRVVRRAAGKADVIVSFHTSRAELERRLPALRALMDPAAGLWIAWPKRASGLPTDITEDVVREVALPTGLVDVKVCAIDATWSGLKLVVRRELR